jgi:hypothetical protein
MNLNLNFAEHNCYNLTWGAGKGFLPLRHRVQTGSGAHVTSHPVVIGVLSPGVKRPGLESEHLPPSSAEVKNAWSYSSSSQHVVIIWCLIKRREASPSFHT